MHYYYYYYEVYYEVILIKTTLPLLPASLSRSFFLSLFIAFYLLFFLTFFYSLHFIFFFPIPALFEPTAVLRSQAKRDEGASVPHRRWFPLPCSDTRTIRTRTT